MAGHRPHEGRPTLRRSACAHMMMACEQLCGTEQRAPHVRYVRCSHRHVHADYVCLASGRHARVETCCIITDAAVGTVRRRSLASASPRLGLASPRALTRCSGTSHRFGTSWAGMPCACSPSKRRSSRAHAAVQHTALTIFVHVCTCAGCSCRCWSCIHKHICQHSSSILHS